MRMLSAVGGAGAGVVLGTGFGGLLGKRGRWGTDPFGGEEEEVAVEAAVRACSG
jgi:hypothetical protein